MQPIPKGPIALSIVIITVGVGWLLTSLGFGPGINWIWTLGLGVVGIFAFILSSGLDKVSVILGPFFLISSLLSILRQTGHLTADTEIPVLVIVVGVLLLIAEYPSSRSPDGSSPCPSLPKPTNPAPDNSWRLLPCPWEGTTSPRCPPTPLPSTERPSRNTATNVVATPVRHIE